MWKNLEMAYIKIQYLPVCEGANKKKLQRNLCQNRQFPGWDTEQDWYPLHHDIQQIRLMYDELNANNLCS
jgi:hypothetical protein